MAANPKKKKLAEFEAWLDGREQAETAALAKNPSGRPNPAAASAATAGAGAAVPSSAASGGPPKQAGKWWEIPEQTMTRELKRDLQIIHSRNYLDPKRFYKTRREDRVLPKRFQIGTVVDSAYDTKSMRIAKKDRKKTIAEELLVDEGFAAYGRKHQLAVEDRRGGSSRKAYKQQSNLKKKARLRK